MVATAVRFDKYEGGLIIFYPKRKDIFFEFPEQIITMDRFIVNTVCR